MYSTKDDLMIWTLVQLQSLRSKLKVTGITPAYLTTGVALHDPCLNFNELNSVVVALVYVQFLDTDFSTDRFWTET